MGSKMPVTRVILSLIVIGLLVGTASAAGGDPPIANFTMSNSSGGLPLLVNFTDTSTRFPTAWTWFFGDENYTQGWVRKTASAAWSGRFGHQAVALPKSGYIILTGGYDGTVYKNDTWISTDEGATWAVQNASSEWAVRSNHSMVSLPDNTIVLMGGYSSVGTGEVNDTWTSTDNGVTWTLMNQSSGWVARSNAEAVALYDNSIVLMGGASNQSGGLLIRYNDTWRSTDKGATWILMNASSGWTPRTQYAATALPDNTIVISGGYSDTSLDNNDTWKSTDKGATWTLVNSTAAWSARNLHTTVGMPDNSIVLLGGTSGGIDMNDVWRSNNSGKIWTKINNSAGWSGREAFPAVVLRNGSIVVMGGNTASYYNDTWSFQPTGSNAQYPSHTYTTVGIYHPVLQAYSTYGVNLSPAATVNAGGDLTASFTKNVSTGIVPTTVQFTDTSGNSPISWNWTFVNVTGNMTEVSFSTSQNPTYTFGVGNWSIQLNATNSTGYNKTAPNVSFVNVSTPSVSFVANTTLSNTYPMVVQFNDTTTSFVPTTWNWSFGDGRWQNGTTRNATYTYAVAGRYDVKLYVNNTVSSGSSIQTNYINLTSDDDANVVSWMHMNTTPSAFYDQEGLSWVVTNAVITTSTKQFGDGSGDFTPTNSSISRFGYATLNLSSNDFTIEMWVNPVSASAGAPLIVRTNNASYADGWGLVNINGSTNGYAFYMGDISNATPGFTIPNGQWSHVVVERRGTGIYIYLNGTLVSSKSGASGNYDVYNDMVTIGWIGPGTNKYNGYIDEFRISKNVARWKDNFTTPYAAYVGDIFAIPDINPNSTLRFKTDPAAYPVAYIYNGSAESGRNRTIQIQNVTSATYIVGSIATDPLYTKITAVYPNTSVYNDITLVSYNINNETGIILYNVTRPGGFVSLFNNRTSFLDWKQVYTNYSANASQQDVHFTYGYLINGSTGENYPITTFIETNLTYGAWNLSADFTSNVTATTPGGAVQFTDISPTLGATPNIYNWSFGDMTFNNGTNTSVNHTYAVAGLYTVKLYTGMWQNSSIVSTKEKIDYINVTASAPFANFTANTTTGYAPATIQFTDLSNNTPTSWNWSFGDGNYSSSQNPVFTYVNGGNYTVNLTATNAAGSNTTRKVNYTQIGVGSGFTQQDLEMNGVYTLKITFYDSSTASIIPVVTVVDSLGNTQTTINGTYYGTFDYGTAGIYVSSSGYYSRSTSYFMDGDRNESFQLTKESSSSQTQFVSTKTVRFVCQDWEGMPIKNMNVTAIGVETSLGSIDWVPTLFGINLGSTPILNTSMIGQTGNDGSITYVMLPTEKYALHYQRADLGINETRYYYPQESEYIETFWTETPSYSLNNIDYQFYSERNVTNHTMRVWVVYNDTYNSTDNVTVMFRNNSKMVVYQTRAVPT